MRRDGAAVRLVSSCADLRKEEVHIGMYVESYCLKGPVLPQGCSESLSLKRLGQGILELGQGLDRLGAECNQP